MDQEPVETVNLLLLHGTGGWGRRMVNRMQEVLYQHVLLDRIYMDYLDAPGGQGNWGLNSDESESIPEPLQVKESVEASAALVEAKMLEAFEQGFPFHAVVGFSQGASLAALVASRLCEKEQWKDLKWIFMAGDASFLWELGVEAVIGAKSLHIAGKNDYSVPFHESAALWNCFDQPRIFEHSQGHDFLPADAFLEVVDFLNLSLICRWCGSANSSESKFHMFNRRAFCNTCWVAYGGPRAWS